MTTSRTDIINFYIAKHRLKKYLEIGVADGSNIKKINIRHKDGVDPGPGELGRPLSPFVNYKMTSDDFFNKIKNQNVTYDFIFIDGLHHSAQVDKDVCNSFQVLNENGFIMLHDSSPSSFACQAVPRKQVNWNGDVWKSVVKLRCCNANIEIFTIDTDCGCTILKRGSQELYNKKSLTEALDWDYFVQNRKELLNLISVEEFIKKLS